MLNPRNWIYQRDGKYHNLCHSRYMSLAVRDNTCDTCQNIGKWCKQPGFPNRGVSGEHLVLDKNAEIDIVPFLMVVSDKAKLQKEWFQVKNKIRDCDRREPIYRDSNVCILAADSVFSGSLRDHKRIGLMTDEAYDFFAKLFKLYQSNSLYNKEDERNLSNDEILQICRYYPNLVNHLVNADNSAIPKGRTVFTVFEPDSIQFKILATTISTSVHNLEVLDLTFAPDGSLTETEKWINECRRSSYYTNERLLTVASASEAVIDAFIYGEISAEKFLQRTVLGDYALYNNFA
jgi:hypothetical protein